MTGFIPFSLKIDYSDSDVFRVAQYLQNRSVIYRYSWFFIPAGVAFIIFMVIQSMAYSTDQINYISVALLCLVPALILSIAILLSKRLVDPWFLNRRITKLRTALPGFAETVSFNFTLEYIESSTSLASSKLTWKSFSKVMEIEDSFLFWAGGIPLFLIPKRALQDAGTEERFRELVRNKVLTE